MTEESPADMPGFKPGSMLAGYRLEARVGSGGMAVVYRARDERLRRPVALKILAPQFLSDQEFRRRFIGESLAAAAVDDPHIIPVYGAGESDGVLFIAMRFVNGGDLRHLLNREGVLSPAQAAEVISPVASALDAAHNAGLVHRDVKPGNVLVDTGPGRPDHVYLSDFGISKSASAVTLTGTGQFFGTPGYSAPEQVEGRGDVDGRADQYALACVTYELLTAQTPFQHRNGMMSMLIAHVHEPPPTLTSRNADLPAAANDVMAKALAKNPDERYATCADFADALRDALDLPSYHAHRRPRARPQSQPHDETSLGTDSPPYTPTPPGTPAPTGNRTPTMLSGAVAPPSDAARSVAPASQAPPSQAPPSQAPPSQAPPSQAPSAAPADDVSAPNADPSPTMTVSSVQRGDLTPAPAPVPAEPVAPREQTMLAESIPPERVPLPDDAPDDAPAADLDLPPQTPEAQTPEADAPEALAPVETLPEPVAEVAAPEPAGDATRLARVGPEADTAVAEGVDTAALAGPADSTQAPEPALPEPESAAPQRPDLQQPEPRTPAPAEPAPAAAGKLVTGPPTELVEAGQSILPNAGQKTLTPTLRMDEDDAADDTWLAGTQVVERPGTGVDPSSLRPDTATGTGWRRRLPALAAGGVLIVAAAAVLPFVLKSPAKHPIGTTSTATAPVTAISSAHATATPAHALTYHATPLGLPASYQGNSINSLAFNPVNQTLAIAGAGTCLWDLPTTRCTVQVGAVRAVAFSPDGQTLVGSGNVGVGMTPFVLLVNQGKNPLLFPSINDTGIPSTSVNSVAFNHDGKTVAAGDLDGLIYLWNAVTKKAITHFQESIGVNALAFTPDGKTLITGDGHGVVYLWSVPSGKKSAPLVGLLNSSVNSPGVVSLAVSPDGKTLAVAEDSGKLARVYLWNLDTRQPTGHVLTDPKSDFVTSVAFSHDGKTLAVGDNNGSAYLWNLPTRKVTATLPDPEGLAVDAVAFSPSGDTVATADDGGSVYVWSKS